MVSDIETWIYESCGYTKATLAWRNPRSNRVGDSSGLLFWADFSAIRGKVLDLQVEKSELNRPNAVGAEY